MKRVLVIAPGALAAGDSAGLGNLAALTVRALAAEGVHTVVLSPHASCPAVRFAARAYAEPVDARSLAAIAAAESIDAIFIAAAGPELRQRVLDAKSPVPLVGIPGGTESLAKLAARSATTNLRSDGVESGTVLVEVLRDAQGELLTLGVFDASVAPALSDSTLTTVTDEARKRAHERAAAAALASSDIFGAISLRFVGGEPREIVFGARASTSFAAAIRQFPLAEALAAIARGGEVAQFAARLDGSDWEAIRVPVLVHARFPGSEGVAAGVGQVVKTPDESPARNVHTASNSQNGTIVVIGAGGASLDRPDGADGWAAEAVLAAIARGHHVTVVDDDPASLAGGLASTWTLASPLAAAGLVGTDVLGVFVAASPDPVESARAFELRNVPVLDGGSRTRSTLATLTRANTTHRSSARKLDVVLLAEASEEAESVTLGSVEYVEPASIHVGDSAAFFPPQTIPAPVFASAEDAARSLAASHSLRGLVTATFALEDEGPELLELRIGPSFVEPFVSRAVGFALGELDAHIAFGATLAELGVTDVSTPDFVAARESTMPRALLAASDAVLDGSKRSIGDAIGVGDTAAGAYAKALAGVGFALGDRSKHSVVLAPGPEAVDDATRGARKLYPLGFRLLAVGEVATALRGLRIPFQAVTEDEARAAIAHEDVALAFVTAGRPRATELRASALARGIPCFTSSLLFRAACAVLEEGVQDPVKPLPALRPAVSSIDAKH